MTVPEPLAGVPSSGHRRGWRWLLLVADTILVGAVPVYFHEVATHRHEVDGYTTSQDGRQLMIGYSYGECEMWRKESLVEQTLDRVVVAVTYVPDSWLTICTSAAYRSVATFTLDGPLGDREVVHDAGETFKHVPARTLLDDRIAPTGNP